MATAELNIWLAWLGILAGTLTGAVQGLWFHRPDWLGGYASWPRRMLHLGHIAWLGVGLLNLAFAVTVRWLGRVDAGRVAVPSAVLSRSRWRRTTRR